MLRLIATSLIFCLIGHLAIDSFGQESKPTSDMATPADKVKVLKDFKVERLYSVPRVTEGSWVCLCVDGKGRLIASDQGGGLYRITPPAIGSSEETKVEKVPAAIGGAQGLLWAFDSLYVVVNGGRPQNGLFRVRDTDGDDQLDEVKLLRALDGGGEHGPHAVILSPDKKSLTVVHGNQTKITKYAKTRVPPVWGEDHLLPRMPDGNGFMAGVLGPGGALYKVDPDGQNWELVCVGFRNQYDAAYNRHGDLFTYDADMEWDFNTPWYRPTRVCLAASGADFGWRNGAGKWPAYYADSLPAVVDIGPGSPTGIAFGYGAKFPAKYQGALFICDWSYGKMYAVHLTPERSAYKGTFEEFLSGSPLPLTDVVIHPTDGAMYFAIGGRGTQSGLYRVTYTGSLPTVLGPPAEPTDDWNRRKSLESLHGVKKGDEVEVAMGSLGLVDPYVRNAARVAIEHQDPEELHGDRTWPEMVFSLKDDIRRIEGLLALVRVSAPDPFHRKPNDPPADPKLRARIVDALARIEWPSVEVEHLELLRTYHVLFNRFGKPTDDERKQVLAAVDAQFPAKSTRVNAELLQLLVYLEAPNTASRAVKLLSEAPTQEEQIEYARSLRMLKTGWTPELRQEYFTWFLKAGTFKGGSSFTKFMANIKRDAVATLSAEEKTALQPILDARPEEAAVAIAKPRPFVKKWTLDELALLVTTEMKNRDFDRGRSLFGAASCFACHRFGNEGGANGPDLTGLAGRFSARDLLESTIDPSKVVSDQYQATTFVLDNGKTVTGRIVNMSNDNWSVNTDMLNPGGAVNVNRKQVESIIPSKISMMPTGLLDTLKEDEVLDLFAFLLSRGDRKNAMFK